MLKKLFKSLLPLYTFFSLESVSHPGNSIQNNPSSSYYVKEEFIQSDPIRPEFSYDTLEDKFYLDEHHFVTCTSYSNENSKDKEVDIFALRTHPGKDPDGWGFTLYLQPFIHNLSYNSILSHTNHPIEYIVNENNIEVNASGKVSHGLTQTYGTWKSSLNFSYNPNSKIVNASGSYNIVLDGTLEQVQRDLNLYKLASNFLVNVPLLSGGNGETGDMKKIVYFSGDNFSSQWNPLLLPAHFPGDLSSKLSVLMHGEYNKVDTLISKGHRINAAYKPSIDITLQSNDPTKKMIFGGIYSLHLSQLFNEDNIGITPIVTQGSPNTTFDYKISFSSFSPEPSSDSKIILDYASKWQQTEFTYELIDSIKVVK